MQKNTSLKFWWTQLDFRYRLAVTLLSTMWIAFSIGVVQYFAVSWASIAGLAFLWLLYIGIIVDFD